jgi:hypothetical protein
MRLPLDLRLEETLRALRLDPLHVSGAAPIAGGLSGARLTRLWLEVPAGDWPGAPAWRGARVVKELAAGEGWIATATHDTRIRETALWQTGLAALLPRQIGLAVERVTPPNAPDAVGPRASAALLMRDVRARLMRAPYRTPRGHLPPPVLAALDALAALHARFWESAALEDPRLGLASLHETLLWLAPEAIDAAIAAGIDEPYLALARRGWQAFFQLAPPEDAATLAATLARPERALSTIARLPRTLIHGDVWGPNLGRLPRACGARGPGTRTLLIDWALVAAAPATWDPLAMCGAWHTLSPVTVLAAYRARLSRRLRSRGIALEPATWQLLVAAAYVRGALTLGEAFARAASEAQGAVARRQALARVRWWARRGARAARLLERN